MAPSGEYAAHERGHPDKYLILIQNSDTESSGVDVLVPWLMVPRSRDGSKQLVCIYEMKESCVPEINK